MNSPKWASRRAEAAADTLFVVDTWRIQRRKGTCPATHFTFSTYLWIYYSKAEGLIDKFSSPLPSVTHDDEDRFYVLKGADGKLLVYDVDKYGAVELSQAALS
jgi:hypothetical protein